MDYDYSKEAFDNRVKYCWEVYGSYVGLNEETGEIEYFVCPDCGDPIYYEDWISHYGWKYCPICDFNFEESE